MKVMYTVHVKLDDKVLSRETKVFAEYAKVDYAAQVVADMDPLDNGNNRMRLIGSQFHYDPEVPLRTTRNFAYRMGSVVYEEFFTIED